MPVRHFILPTIPIPFYHFKDDENQDSEKPKLAKLARKQVASKIGIHAAGC